ncbi:MAG: hypothetical protein Q7U12_09290, partial [Undibacterium sp.]|nr:hypothetical protein [Undibacterium sp.]
MKKFLMILFLLSAFSLPSAAQTAAEIDTVTITEPARQITIPSKLYKMWPEEFYKFVGAYDLSNGQVLALFDR